MNQLLTISFNTLGPYRKETGKKVKLFYVYSIAELFVVVVFCLIFLVNRMC